MITFYKKITTENIKFINDKFALDGLNRYKFVNCKTSDEYLDFYISEKRNFLQMTEGVELKKFIN